MKASEINTEEAQTKTDRQLLETVYSVLVTPEPTDLVPDPPPGLIERVKAVQEEQGHVAAELTEHRVEVDRKLRTDHADVKALLEQHAAADERNFQAIAQSLANNGKG